MKTYTKQLTPELIKTLSQIDPYKIYDYLSTQMIMFGGIKPEEVEDTFEIPFGQFEVEKYMDDINNAALEDSDLKHSQFLFLREMMNLEDEDLPF